nr:hypothetical protein [Paenibacillus xylanilyticus]
MALGVGFNTPDYFSPRFTSYYGLSPTNYRRKFKRRGILITELRTIPSRCYFNN